MKSLPCTDQLASRDKRAPRDVGTSRGDGSSQPMGPVRGCWSDGSRPGPPLGPGCGEEACGRPSDASRAVRPGASSGRGTFLGNETAAWLSQAVIGEPTLAGCGQSARLPPTHTPAARPGRPGEPPGPQGRRCQAPGHWALRRLWDGRHRWEHPATGLVQGPKEAMTCPSPSAPRPNSPQDP